MYLRPPQPGPAQGAPRDSRIVVPTPEGPRHIGHAHFWERALSRRQLIRTAAGTTAVVLGAGLLPAVADAAGHGGTAPNPIPGGDPGIEQAFGKLFHVFFPYFGQEVSTITDFNGNLAAAEMQGAGTGVDTKSGAATRYTYDADMRIMDGLYVAKNGQLRQGTFGFV